MRLTFTVRGGADVLHAATDPGNRGNGDGLEWVLTLAAAALGLLSGAAAHAGLPLRLVAAIATAGGAMAAGLVALARSSRTPLARPRTVALPPEL